MQVVFHCRPHPAETVCGDLVTVSQAGSATTLAVTDGLGHGPEARRAALEAHQVIMAHPALGPAELLHRCHEALRPTRGAALGILRVDGQGAGAFAGVGNIAVLARAQAPIHVICQPGVVGQRMRKVQEFPFRCGPGDLLCVTSDGIGSALRLDGVSALRLEEWPRRLVELFGRSNDDATVALLLV